MNDPCPRCDGDEYDEASGECSECGYGGDWDEYESEFPEEME